MVHVFTFALVVTLVVTGTTVNAGPTFDVECTSDDPCQAVEGATCDMTQGICHCPGFTVISSDMLRCLPVAAGAGMPCEEDSQCSTIMLMGGQCVEGKCACTEGKHYHNGLCWDSKALGEECSSNEECLSLYPPEYIRCGSAGVCECAEGMRQREYLDCRPVIQVVGDPCAINFDCYINNSYCDTTELVCKCLIGESNPGATDCPSGVEEEGFNFNDYLIEENEEYSKPNLISEDEILDLAEKAGEFGATCTEDTDCSNLVNARCTISGYCACERGYRLENDICTAELGGPCQIDNDCTMANSKCVNQECTCLIGYGVSTDRATCHKQYTTINRGCTEDAPCLLFGARCNCLLRGNSTYACQCAPGSREIKNEQICWIRKGPGESCSDPRDCFVDTDNNPIVCDETDFICKCKPGFHPSKNESNCHRDATTLGARCIENEDCTLPNTECTGSDQIKFCTCRSGYYEHKLECVAGVGATCKITEDCFNVTNSECAGGTCQCLPKYVPQENIKACLPESNYGASCDEIQQCTAVLGEFGICNDDELCACATGHHLQNETCVPYSALGESCDDSLDCWLPGGTEGLVCRNYKCACDFGYAPSDTHDQCINGALSHSVSIGLLALLVTMLVKST